MEMRVDPSRITQPVDIEKEDEFPVLTCRPVEKRTLRTIPHLSKLLEAVEENQVLDRDQRYIIVSPREDLARHYQAECEKLLALVEERCFVLERGLYKEGPATEEYSQHTQIYAVLAGLARGEKARALMEKVLADKSLIPCSFMQGYYLFRALEKAGMYHCTEPLWQTWQDFLDLHCTTFPETPYDPRSDCHGWSALPLWEFAEHKEEL